MRPIREYFDGILLKLGLFIIRSLIPATCDVNSLSCVKLRSAGCRNNVNKTGPSEYIFGKKSCTSSAKNSDFGRTPNKAYLEAGDHHSIIIILLAITEYWNSVLHINRDTSKNDKCCHQNCFNQSPKRGHQFITYIFYVRSHITTQRLTHFNNSGSVW